MNFVQVNSNLILSTSLSSPSQSSQPVNSIEDDRESINALARNILSLSNAKLPDQAILKKIKATDAKIKDLETPPPCISDLFCCCCFPTKGPSVSLVTDINDLKLKKECLKIFLKNRNHIALAISIQYLEDDHFGFRNIFQNITQKFITSDQAVKIQTLFLESIDYCFPLTLSQDDSPQQNDQIQMQQVVHCLHIEQNTREEKNNVVSH